MNASTWRTIGRLPSTLGALALMSVLVGLLPWPAAAAVLLAWVACAVLAGLGRWEHPLSRFALSSTREPTPAETAAAYQILREAGVPASRTELLVDQEQVAAQLWGRRTITLPEAMLHERVVSPQEAAFLVRSDVRAQGGAAGEPAWTVIRLPWLLLDRLVLRPIGVTFLDVVPLARWAWNVRWVWFFFGAFVAWRSGDVTDALPVYVFIALTYVRPVALWMEHRANRRATARMPEMGELSAQVA